MYNRNPYFDAYFKKVLEDLNEKECLYFYKKLPGSLRKIIPQLILFQEFGALINKHFIVAFTEKRILICEMNPTSGNLSGNIGYTNFTDAKDTSFKKGLFRIKVTITFIEGDSEIKIQLKPNNFCIGMSNHKKHLATLTNKFEQ